MSQQAPILVISAGGPNPVATTTAAALAALSAGKVFPVLETGFSEAAGAIAQLQPAAVLISGDTDPAFRAVAVQVAELSPYVPLIALDPRSTLPCNALPCAPRSGSLDGLVA